MMPAPQPDQSTLDTWLQTEWLETNGLGGFACSTVVGCNTRRYHGLLVTDPHAGTTQPPRRSPRAAKQARRDADVR